MEKQHRNIPIAPSSTLPSANIHHYNMRIKTETLKRTQYYWMSYWSEGNLSHPKWDYEGQGCLVMKREEEEKHPEGVGWDACNPSMRQEDCEFDSSLGYIETLCQKQTNKKIPPYSLWGNNSSSSNSKLFHTLKCYKSLDQNHMAL